MTASNVTMLSDLELLARLVGEKTAARYYRGSLKTTLDRASPVAARLAVARELIMRSLGEKLRRECVLTSPAAVREFLQMHFAGRDYESFVVLFVDAQNRLIAAEELFRGTLTQAAVFPREVVKTALTHSAAGVIFAHNHPSGLAEPSGADEMITRTLKGALSLVDVRVLDHFVVAGTDVISFAERGLLS